MQLLLVNTPKLAADFIEVSVLLHSKDPNWIRPLDKDIKDVFDKDKNKTFRFGEIERWLLKDASGHLIGRIAAFTNKKYKNKGDEFPAGGFGFLNVSIIRKLPICYWIQQKTGYCKKVWNAWMDLSISESEIDGGDL
jgi:hypothetical protein